jgi:hypothetical protein
MIQDSFEYMLLVYEAHTQLHGECDPEAIRQAADRHRAVAPDHSLLSVLDAKHGSMHAPAECVAQSALQGSGLSTLT